MGAVAQRNMVRFAKKNAVHLTTALQNQPVFFALFLAQGSIESGYGTSSLAKNKNNFFGVMSGGSAKIFTSPSEAFLYQVKLLTTGRYLQAGVPTASTPYEQLRRIADAGYYSMNDDDTLPVAMLGKRGSYTAKQSADWYVKNMTPFIDDALKVLPIGKITAQNSAQAFSAIATTV